MSIPIIDLFAGPGGLGEGFSSVVQKGIRPFRIAVSVEKDPYAHKTLSLRAFYRWSLHEDKQITDHYYRHLSGEIDLEKLFALHPEASSAVQKEALCAELGNPKYQPLIDSAIQSAVKGRKDWLLIGGPPCQAYSLVGRSRMQNAEDYREKHGHDFSQDHRHKLYQEYLRIIYKFSPAVFVMENVKGILSAKLDGELIFPRIIADLSDPQAAAIQYGWEGGNNKKFKIVSFVTGSEEEDPKEYLIKAEAYGIPQARHRVILLGIREDVWARLDGGITPLEKCDSIKIEHIIGMLPHLRSGFSKGKDGLERWNEYFQQVPDKTWVKALDVKTKSVVLDACQKLQIQRVGREHRGKGGYLPNIQADWYADNDLHYLPNHETRSHMDSDLDRYLFVSAFGFAHKRSPHLKDFPSELLPAHENVDITDPNQKFSDRFKVQLWDQPSSTITSHISKDGHYFIHPDPSQCRSLTVREAARIQTFPDNYFFEGGRTQQYHQVGNAVPPYLAKQLAEVVYEIFCKIR